MAILKEISNSDSSTGVESLLDNIAWVVLVLCVLGSLVLLIESDANALVIALAFYGVLSGVMIFALFRAAAEGLRLLKHSADVPYNGELKKIFKTGVCSACSKTLYGDEALANTSCFYCGAKFE